MRHCVKDSIPNAVIGFFRRSDSTTNTVVLGSTQLLTEMSTVNVPEGKGQLACKAHNLTAISKLIV
jgi:hypothetical protein